MLIKIPKNKDNDDYTTAIVSSTPIHYPLGNTVPGQYLLQIHDGSTFTNTLNKMDTISDFPINKTRVATNPYLPVVDSLPAWLKHGCKVTYVHVGEFHKGYIMIGHDGMSRFYCRRQRSSKYK